MVASKAEFAAIRNTTTNAATGIYGRKRSDAETKAAKDRKRV
jgi:hypothetical protein